MNTHVDFEIAKLLKEKGFDIPMSRAYHVESKHLLFAFSAKSNNEFEDIHITAPTITETVMWLYEKHKIWIEVRKHTRDMLLCFSPYIDNTPINSDVFFNDYDSPTEAYEAGIEHTLKHLI